MTQTRFNGLALLHVHQEIDINTEEVLDMFARKHNRRMQTMNILDNTKDAEQDDSEWRQRFVKLSVALLKLFLRSFEKIILYYLTESND